MKNAASVRCLWLVWVRSVIIYHISMMCQIIKNTFFNGFFLFFFLFFGFNIEMRLFEKVACLVVIFQPNKSLSN